MQRNKKKKIISYFHVLSVMCVSTTLLAMDELNSLKSNTISTHHLETTLRTTSTIMETMYEC